jgi:hypothetical protein
MTSSVRVSARVFRWFFLLLVATLVATLPLPALSDVTVTCDTRGGQAQCPGNPQTTAFLSHAFSEASLDTAFWEVNNGNKQTVTPGDIVLCEGAARADKTSCAPNIAMSDVLSFRCAFITCEALLSSEQEAGEANSPVSDRQRFPNPLVNPIFFEEPDFAKEDQVAQTLIYTVIDSTNNNQISARYTITSDVPEISTVGLLICGLVLLAGYRGARAVKFNHAIALSAA